MQIQYVNSMAEFLLLWSSSVIHQDNSWSQLSTNPSSTSQMSNRENNLNHHVATGTSIGPYKSQRHVKAPGTQEMKRLLKASSPQLQVEGISSTDRRQTSSLEWQQGKEVKGASNLYVAISFSWCQGWLYNQVHHAAMTHPCMSRACSCSWKRSLGARSSSVRASV